MKRMIYSAERLNPPKRIASGNYKGFAYYVLNLGTHPCAYVDVTNTQLENINYEDIDIDCHGGLTYSADHLKTVNRNGWFIGWDYAHFCDFNGYELLTQTALTSYGKKWTTREIVSECKNVIEQIIEISKGG